MIADLKPYPAMKDSGVLWLGELPEHWEVRKLRHVLKRVAERNRPDLPLLSVVREKGVIQRDTTSKDQNHNFIPDDLSNYKVVCAGQFAMNKMKAWQGSYGVSHYDGIVSPAYFVFDVSGIEGEFFHAAIRSKTYIPFFTQASDGVRIGQWDLAQARMKEIPLFVPPMAEQVAIVRFIDHADRRIRRYILAKQKLIKLLEEQKQVIIHRAVTRGLDPSVRLKSLGSAPRFEVNAQWRVARLWEVSRIRSEKKMADLGLLSVFLGRGVIPYEQGAGQVHKPSFDLASYQVVHPGDLVLNNQQAWRGSVGVSKYRGIISPAYVVLGLADLLESRFADYLFQSRVMVSQFVTSSKGVGDIQRDIHMPWLKNARVPIPLLEEQRTISVSLDHELADIARQLSLLERETALLREYRTRLIADVVTGKLDVREAAARLPNESEDSGPEILDENEKINEGENVDGASESDAASEEKAIYDD